MKNKDKEENKKKKSGDILSSQGETFYESIPATAVAPQELVLPKVSVRTAEFLESVVFFFAGTAIVLLMIRVVLMILGVQGGNLLIYLLYAASYPFVFILGSAQQQVPSLTNAVLYENIAIMVVYFVISYGLLKLIKVFKGDRQEKNITN